jgi:hypothetical protein
MVFIIRLLAISAAPVAAGKGVYLGDLILLVDPMWYSEIRR